MPKVAKENKNLTFKGVIYNHKKGAKKLTLYYCRGSRRFNCKATLRLHKNGYAEGRGLHSRECELDQNPTPLSDITNFESNRINECDDASESNEEPNSDENIQQRSTVNYNQTMNDMFPTHHPTLLTFVKTIEAESRRQVQQLTNIVLWHGIPHEHQETTFGDIASFYWDFTT